MRRMGQIYVRWRALGTEEERGLEEGGDFVGH